MATAKKSQMLPWVTMVATPQPPPKVVSKVLAPALFFLRELVSILLEIVFELCVHLPCILCLWAFKVAVKFLGRGFRSCIWRLRRLIQEDQRMIYGNLAPPTWWAKIEILVFSWAKIIVGLGLIAPIFYFGLWVFQIPENEASPEGPQWMGLLLMGASPFLCPWGVWRGTNWLVMKFRSREDRRRLPVDCDVL